MRTDLIYKTFCAAVFAITLSLHGADGENLLYNSGFEDSGYIYDWRASGCTLKQVADSSSGKYSAMLRVSTPAKAAYIENGCPRIRAVAGETWELSIMAKGRGTIKLSCYRLGGTPMHLKGLGSVSSKAFELTGKWQRFTFKHTFTNPDILEFSYRILPEGKNAEIYLDDAELKLISSKKAVFKINTASIMAYPGQEMKFSAGIEYPGKTVPSILQITQMGFGKHPQTSSMKLNNGLGEIILKVPKNKQGETLKLNLFDPASGVGKHIFIEVFSKAHYDAIKQVAAAQKAPGRKLNVLILGDSLSDLFRGQNYVDWLEFWTSQYFPGRIKWCNYGVRGDYISRILRRLQGDMVWGRRRFEGVYAHIPDVVIIFCGHNDSRLTRSSGYKKSKVALDDFRRELRSLIQLLRKKNSSVRIILLTPASSNFTQCRAVWQKKGKSSDLFGTPEIMQQFQQAVKDASNEEKCDLIDIFARTKAYPRNSELFQPDGVHLSSTGTYFVALEVLQGLTKAGYWDIHKK